MATTLETYLATLTPLARGKARAALERNTRMDGVIVWRWLAAETLAARADVRVDFGKGRIWTGGQTFYAIADLTKAVADYIAWLKAPYTAA